MQIHQTLKPLFHHISQNHPNLGKNTRSIFGIHWEWGSIFIYHRNTFMDTSRALFISRLLRTRATQARHVDESCGPIKNRLRTSHHATQSCTSREHWSTVVHKRKWISIWYSFTALAITLWCTANVLSNGIIYRVIKAQMFWKSSYKPPSELSFRYKRTVLVVRGWVWL